MDVSKRDRRMWLRRELFVLSPAWFAAIMVFQQVFDLLTTLYLTSLPGGQEANPILAPLWEVPGGMWWLVAIKFFACLLIVTGVPWLHKHHPDLMLAPKVACCFYWLLVAWNGYLVVCTLL